MTSEETLPAFGSNDTARARDGVKPLPQAGDLVLERYRIERELGRGGQAIVFEAHDVQLDRRVALKVLTPSLDGGSTENWRGLHEEARLQAAVEAPGVARLLDALRDGEARYIVMELVRGPGLGEVIAELRDRRLGEGTRPRSGAWLAEAAHLDPDSPAHARLTRLTWDRAVADFGRSLATSVGCLHERGLIHRDLKPGNLKLDSEGRPVVLDFGLARWLGAPKEERLQGTLGYMAPEQFGAMDDDSPLHGAQDARTDVYQVGLILYELLSLERAFPADALRDLSHYLELARAGRVPAIGDVDRHANVGLAAVIGLALAANPVDRYGSLTELALDLERVATGRAPRHAPTPLAFRARSAALDALRSPVIVALLAFLILVPVAWTVRAAMIADVTSIEGWIFSPLTDSQVDVVSGSPVQVGDDLGIRVSTSTSTVVYVLSVFGGAAQEERLVSPMRPLPLVNGVPQPNASPLWGLQLDAGTHELLCTRIEEANPREGLLVFATPDHATILERWLNALEQRLAVTPFGIEQDVAFALLDELRVPDTARGGTVLAAAATASDAELSREQDRYAGLSAAKAAGREEWDLAANILRFGFLCEVVSQ